MVKFADRAGEMNLSRRGFLGTTAATALSAAFYGYCWESKWLELTHTVVRIGGTSAAAPIRILHLSDLHWSSYDSLRFLQSAFELGLTSHPDLICLTGDFVCVGGEYNLDEYRPTLECLSKAAPTFAVFGNHDGGTWSCQRGGFGDTWLLQELLEKSGIQVLVNHSTKLALHGLGINLVGLADLWSKRIDPKQAFAGVSRKEEEVTIVLAHNPDSKDSAPEYDWQLMLSGHTHGGQVAFPLIGPPYVPVRDRRYIAGLNPWGQRLLYTTRGVGSLYGTRFYCRPEVSLLDIV